MGQIKDGKFGPGSGSVPVRGPGIFVIRALQPLPDAVLASLHLRLPDPRLPAFPLRRLSSRCCCEEGAIVKAAAPGGLGWACAGRDWHGGQGFLSLAAGARISGYCRALFPPCLFTFPRGYAQP
eukprot:759314-Rhodomonas_salina.2